MNGTENAVLEQRMAAATASAADLGFDALVVYARGSGAAFGSKSHGYMRYLRDWDTYYSPGALVLVPGQPRALVTSDIFLHKLTQKSLIPGENALFAPLPEMGAAVARVLREALPGRTALNIAYLGRTETPVPFWEGFISGLGPDTAVEDFEPHLSLALAVKDTGQYALHRRAAAICDSMFGELDRLARSGLSTWHLRAAMEKTARDAGAEHALIWLTVAPVAESCHFYREDSTRAPQPGDQILCGIYALYRGHWGHGIRMGSLGPGTPAMLRAYAVVREMQDAGMAALRPGEDLHGVNDAMEAVFARHFPDGGKSVFRFRAAHGLGHFSEDPLTTDPFQHGYIPAAPQAKTPIPIRRGMLFELHPNCFPTSSAHGGAEGAALGDMVHVGENGPELLLQFPREFRNWGA